MRYVVGVDEAGRGPLAGPVAVGVAVVPDGFDWGLLPGVGDSKKLTPRAREQVYKQAAKLKQEGVLNFAVTQTSAQAIDRIGIVPAIKRALETGLKKLALDPISCAVRLDGGLKAPSLYIDQVTIIKGDALEPIIGLASIVAKVTRDRHMVRISTSPIFAPYQFEIHKGYGTKRHCELIKLHGLSAIHRESFCRSFQN